MLAESPAAEAASNLSDFIERWGNANVSGGDIMPSPETLAEVSLALHNIEEFLVEPIVKALKRISADSSAENDDRPVSYPINEDARAVTYDNIGRLIVWTDELRMNCHYLLVSITEATLLAHEDLSSIAAGYIADGVLEDRSWRAQMVSFHGLDRAP
jgi:hypothetical protein